MNITIPDDVYAFLEEQRQQAGFRSIEEYVLQAALLAHPDEMRPSELETLLQQGTETAVVRERLEKALVEGLNSGPSIPATAEFWAERRLALEKHTTS